MSFDKRRSNSIAYPNTQVEASWCRTNTKTYASYFGDGSGRDSYVIKDNGGLTR